MSNAARPDPPAASPLARLRERLTRGELLPKSVVCWREGYTRERLLGDLGAGLVVGIVALPLAIAFAIASGVTPERGLFTAIVAGFLISSLGGSRVQIGGPTGAFVVLVAAIIGKYHYDGLVIATLMAGLILVVMGLSGFGSLIKFIPHPVITGFTSGIAVIIFSSQVRDLFGLNMEAVPSEFIAKWGAFTAHADAANPWAAAIAAGTILVVILLPRATGRIPAPFAAMILATLAVHFLKLPVETIGSRFGAVPQALPLPHLPAVSWARVQELATPAITIALLAAIESLLSAVVADGMIGSRHKSNMELVAQGLANAGSALMGGIPATGAIARTATNVKSGGRTPLAGIVHALVLLLVLVFFGRWAAMIPLASLAGILAVVAYHMSEWRTFRALLRAPKSDVLVLLVTFGLTVFVDLNVAVQAGVVIAALLFMRRMAEVTRIEWVTDALRDRAENPDEIETLSGGRLMIGRHVVPEGVEVYEIHGPFFFAAAETLKEVLTEITRRPRVFILRMRNVPAIDATGILALEQVFLRCRGEGIAFILCEVRDQPWHALSRAGKAAVFGRHNFMPDLAAALALAGKIAAGPGRFLPEHDPGTPRPAGGR